MESHIVSNIAVVLLLVATAVTAYRVKQSAIWSNAFVQLVRTRPIALAVIGFYILVALLDSVAWVGGKNEADALSQHQAQTVLDRLFAGSDEKSYSAPMASVEFVGGADLSQPGSHLLGTDLLGRDVLYRTLKGARVALMIGGLTSLMAIPLALLFGVPAGYRGGRLDDVVFFVMSTLASMPGLLLLIALVMVLGKSTASVCFAMAITGWVGFCRLARGETMKLRELDYVTAARALGVPETQIILRHILPNLAHLIIITFVLMFSGLVLSEAVLAWLGIGIEGSWGQMIDQARNELSRDPVIWWNISAAGFALFSLILAINFVGDALRDIFDPRTLAEQP
jgi:peptide/nickel transport system permease protein